MTRVPVQVTVHVDEPVFTERPIGRQCTPKGDGERWAKIATIQQAKLGVAKGIVPRCRQAECDQALEHLQSLCGQLACQRIASSGERGRRSRDHAACVPSVSQS